MSELYFQSLFCLLWIATWYSFPFPMQAAEYHMVDLFERANLCAIHAKRVTISKLWPNEHLFSFAVLCNMKHAIVVKVFQYQGHLCFNLMWYLVSVLFDVQLSEWYESQWTCQETVDMLTFMVCEGWPCYLIVKSRY